MGGYDLAVGTLTLFGEPVDEIGRIDDLASRLADGLAHLEGHDPGEVLLVLEEQLVPAPQDHAAILGGADSPRLLGHLGQVDGPAGLFDAEVGDTRHDVTGGGVGDVEGGAGVGVDPLAADIGLRPQKGRVLKVHGAFLSRRCRTRRSVVMATRRSSP